ncbi:hypothetical protein BURPS1710b_1413 [Burkholderia pseudomallei 1710b]|uniref:Uncharacterized protein n=1 Tax=Burkholderia pseudomallei (strain 1710b) TaxID=320372 RepID=Q3JUD0_BURP1|nr:hypothetical protein BURPS1710b_1413 [Burkholderia pseudomallei 1710b]
MPPVDLQRLEARLAQIVVHRARAAVAEHVDGARHRIGGDGRAARERFEQHEPERVGAAREHEHVGCRIYLGELRLRQHAEVIRLRIARFELGERGALARDPFRAGQVELQERLDVLLDRDAADIQEDRPRGVEHLRFDRPEDVEIDAARPQHDVVEAEALEVVLDDGRRRHHGERRAVEPPQEAIGRRERHAEARLHVFRKARVVRGRERQLARARVAARGEPERAFGRDVQRVRLERVQALAQPPVRQDRQADFGIGRAGHRAEFERRDELDAVAERGELACRALERAHDAVDLRLPRIGDDHDFHRRQSSGGSGGGGFGLARQRGGRRAHHGPVDDLQLALHRLDERGQALDPVAVVAVQHAVDVADLGLVDVAADDAVAAAAARFVGHHCFERRNEVHGVLHLVLQVLRQRPVLEAEAAPDPVEPAVEHEDQRVQRVAEIGEPFRVLDHAVEQVAVDDPQTFARERRVERLAAHVDLAEREVAELARGFVVVAGDVDDLRALSRLAQDLLHHVVVRLRPVPAFPELPAVDDVADEVQVFRFVVLQKVEQVAGLAAARAEMDVRQPDRPVAVRGGFVVVVPRGVRGGRAGRRERVARRRAGQKGAGGVQASGITKEGGRGRFFAHA